MDVSLETAESVSDTQSTTVSKIGSGPIAPLMLLPVLDVPLDNGDRDYGVGGDQGDVPMPNMQPTPISGVCIHAHCLLIVNSQRLMCIHHLCLMYLCLRLM